MITKEERYKKYVEIIESYFDSVKLPEERVRKENELSNLLQEGEGKEFYERLPIGLKNRFGEFSVFGDYVKNILR